ncbi:MAG TPA: LysM peptidoglycan-binding domain-containing protein, partial [Rummeliibacillus sp.]|nr:LysM peptidoglycan-binding domain-containing protein [Rummeliibacillus sp.]
MRVHTVKKGETLWKIARQYGISFEDMKRLNAHLANPDYIVPGMELFLPDAPKKEQPKNTHIEHHRAHPKEQPVHQVHPKEQPVHHVQPQEQPRMAPKPKEHPIMHPKEHHPKEQPRVMPKEHPIAHPKEQPRVIPKEHPIAHPKEQPRVLPKEHPIAQPVQPPVQIIQPIPIPIVEPKPIPHVHPFEEARPVRARIEMIEQHEEEFIIQPQKEYQQPACEPCPQPMPMPMPVPMPVPMPMPCPQFVAPQHHCGWGCNHMEPKHHC